MVTRIEITKTSPPAAEQTLFGGGQQSFVQRLINVIITLDQRGLSGQPTTFAGTDSNTVTLSGHRVSARISNATAPASASATISIWGLTQSVLNQLSQIGQVFSLIQRNNVIVSAGDAFSGMSPVFAGVAYVSYADYAQAPEVPLVMQCQAPLADAVIAAATSSFTGVTDVVTLMQGFATAMGMGFEPNGVTNVKLRNPYYGGNVWSQVQQAADDAGVVAAQVIVGDKPTLAIWPRGKSRTSLTTSPLISPQTGMIGYPAYAPSGYAIIKHLYNPQVHFGGTIEVESSIPLTNRKWIVNQLDLALDSLVPHGDWMGTAYCMPSEFPIPAPPPVSPTQ